MNAESLHIGPSVHQSIGPPVHQSIGPSVHRSTAPSRAISFIFRSSSKTIIADRFITSGALQVILQSYNLTIDTMAGKFDSAKQRIQSALHSVPEMTKLWDALDSNGN